MLIFAALVTTTSVSEELRVEPCDRRLASKCDAQALVSSVYHRLLNAERYPKPPPQQPATT